jgi:hypothetical protein
VALLQGENNQACVRTLRRTRTGRPDNLKIGGSFRSGIEGINNQFRPAPAPHDDVLLALRTNIFAEYDTGHKIKIGGEVFDSRGYLQKPNSSASATEVNALELTQAYLNFDLSDETGNGSNSSLTAGRMDEAEPKQSDWSD